MHLLAGLDTPDRGEVMIEGEAIHTWKESRRANFRAQHIGVVFQNYHLLPDLNVLENVLMPSRALGGWGEPVSELIEKAKASLEAVGLLHRLEHRPVELSGGEQQRLAVARALINDPEILMADEPTGNLDAATGDLVLDDLFRLSEEKKRTLVIVTHDPRLAERCHRTIRLT
jgi:putative ABC transport system ATP-binding protein